MKARDVAVGAAAALICAAIFSSSLGERLQGLGIDSLYRLRDAIYPARYTSGESKTAIVAIDEETYQTPPFKGTPKVLWTKYLATVIESMLEAGVKVIGFDIIFPTSVEGQIRGYDREMRVALNRGAQDNRIILGLIQHREKPIQPHHGYQMAVRRGDNLRPLNVITDSDGVIRRVPLYFRRAGPDGRLMPSMSLEMAQRFIGADAAIDSQGTVAVGGRPIPARVDPAIRSNGVPIRNDVAVRYDQDLGSIPVFSVADLVACAEAGRTEFFRKHFAGRAVMLGTVLDVEDRILSSVRFSGRNSTLQTAPRCIIPVSESIRTEFDRETIPGIYLQATAINNLVRGEVLREVGSWTRIAIVAVLALLAAAATLAFGPTVSAAVVCVAALVWVATATHTFSQDLVLPLFQPLAAAAVTVASLLGYRFAVADRMGRHIRHAFGHYLAPAVVDQLVEENRMPEQGGEMRKMTVWISDLEKYSTIAENFSPTDLVDLLNEVYTVMSDTIEEHLGFVAQFVGDAVVGAFGAPLDDERHADHGMMAALDCARHVNELNQKIALPRGLKLRIRVGISSGNLLVGNIGSKRRLSYAIVGDDINLSSRLEGANKVYGTQILANGESVKLCSDEIAFREIDLIRVVGRDTIVRIFEPLGRSSEVTPERQHDVDAFAEALTLYRKRQFGAAARAFELLAERDPPAAVFASRARHFDKEPPPEDWDGVFNLESK